MKQILGDNQFFGINHYDIDKGFNTKNQFNSNESIISFINSSLNIGLDGFMINSNIRGHEIVSLMSDNCKHEIHYSIPYPHKYSSIVNERGLLDLMKYVLKHSSIKSVFLKLPKFLVTGNVKYIMPLVLDLEIPRNLTKGSYVYLQNILTDFLVGLKRYDLLQYYCKQILSKGYKAGIITLNPILLDGIVSNFDLEIQQSLVLCFNINDSGFNVFPSKKDVEKYVFKKTNYMKMGMSILSSGGVSNVKTSLEFIKSLPLDYVVYGSSNMKNIKSNYELLK